MTHDQDLPLSGTTVLVSRPQHQSQELAQRLSASGAEVVSIPAIEVAPPEEWECVDTALKQCERFDVIVFTSANGVRYFFERLQTVAPEAIISAATTLVAIGPATAGKLKQYNYTAHVVPKRFISDDITATLGDVSGKSVLLPRADIARKQLAIDLKKAGAKVTEVSMYRVRTNSSPETLSLLDEIPHGNAPDYITVTSSSTARGISEILEKSGKSDWLKQSKFVCIGPITASTVEELGYTADIVADVFTTDGIFNALLKEKRDV
jgi:uroporphyrinogen III methyltransferase/synthase